MVDPAANPLLPRVLVNRLWKHHFGEGIVKSTDDFGAMGRTPSHPELLDWLAGELDRPRLVDQGDAPADGHVEHLPDGERPARAMPSGSTRRIRFLHRMNVRRLEAEAIRDSLLAVSGRLEPAMYGPSVPVHLTSFMEGRGRPGRSGPARRRRPAKPLPERPAQLPQSDVPGLRRCRCRSRPWAGATCRTSPRRRSR